MVVDAQGLLGREQELAAVSRFLATIEERPAALALEGEPGIGKTVVVRHALAEGRRHGYRVLSIRPTSAESALSFVGLTDLLSDTHELFADLPSPQRRALEVALLLDEPTDTPPDPRAIGLGLLGVLRALAASCPVVVAVDDLQWLDQASVAALSFALRRVADEPLGVLSARRKDSQGGDLAPGLHPERVELGPLSIGAIHALLAERLQLSIPRSLLLRIHEACGGNPLFALEVGRGLNERGLPEPGQPFEIPTDAETLFAERLGQLFDDTLDALAVAASSAAPTRSLVGAASSGRLEPAIRAGIARLEGDRIDFTHPLFASAVYARLDSAAQRELHRRVATAVTDPEERARHLALAADGPDGDVAAAVSEAVEQAVRRGARAAAAELAELAVELTPEEDTERLRIRRRVAAEQHRDAGDAGRSQKILHELIEELPGGTERARALLELMYTHTGDHGAMLRLCKQAIVEAAGDDLVFAAAARDLSLVSFVTGDPIQARARAREAVAAAERTNDLRLLVSSLAQLARIEIWNGRVTPGLLERALALEESAGYLRQYDSPATIEGLRLMVLEDDLDAARLRLAEAERIAGDHGDDLSRHVLLGHLAQLECRAGRFGDATRYATEQREIREQFGFNPGSTLYFVALVDGLCGRIVAAQAAAERGRASCEREGYEVWAVRYLWLLGFLALSTGDAPAAARILEPLPERLTARGYGPVNVLEVLPDSIEALIAVGEVDRAAIQLEQLEETARSLDIAYALARAARCRGLLATARRGFPAAFDAFAAALAVHERLPDPLERGRTLVALGQARRRAGRRRDARETLRRGLAIFEELGAEPWAEQARAELERIAGRTPSGRELTAAEERVARLVAEGRSNREVAARLFVTERTVETHLSSIYRKLDVRSRTELTRYVAGESGRKTL